METIFNNPKTPLVMFNEKTELRPLPHGATKAQIYKMFPRESEKYLRRLMQSIQIEGNPLMSAEMAKNRHRLTPREFEKFIDVVGVPRGYEEK